MYVTAIMTGPVVKIKMDETLKKIRDIFEQNKFHHILVVDEDQLVGVISDRDLLRELSPFLETALENVRDMNTLHKKAHQIMSREPIKASETTTIASAMEIFLKRNISCLPIVDSGQIIKGIVTWRDILRYYLKKEQDEEKRKGGDKGIRLTTK